MLAICYSSSAWKGSLSGAWDVWYPCFVSAFYFFAFAFCFCFPLLCLFCLEGKSLGPGMSGTTVFAFLFLLSWVLPVVDHRVAWEFGPGLRGVGCLEFGVWFCFGFGFWNGVWFFSRPLAR